MKCLTDRKEIAKAMNFGKYPVLVLDLDNNCGFEGGRYCQGQRVRVAWDHKDPQYAGMTTQGNIYMEDGRIAISGNAACLHADFGYYDVMDMAAWANAPVVHKGETVVVVMKSEKAKTCVVRMMKVSDHINIHCMTVARLEDIE